MEPNEALNACESALRNIVDRVMPGGQWMMHLNAKQRKYIEDSRASEIGRRDAVKVSDNLLAFTNTRHLTTIIDSNWDEFASVFKNKTRTAVAFEALNSYRNTVAHSRELRPFERDLLSGISGQIRNQVALFLSNLSAPARFYPVIESAVDSSGNVPTGNYCPYSASDRPRWQVGDVITFDCSATDPRGLELDWRLYAGDPLSSGIANPVIHYGQVTGGKVSLRMDVTTALVMEHLHVRIDVRNAAPYRLHNGSLDQYDDSALFCYSVDPPLA